MKSELLNQESKVMEELKLNKLETEAFSKACKRGIYKELHAKNLLTDQQLNQLLDDTY